LELISTDLFIKSIPDGDELLFGVIKWEIWSVYCDLPLDWYYEFCEYL